MAISARLRDYVLERDGFTCQVCKFTEPTGKDLQIDHKQSLFECGSNSLNNLWVLCKKCNREKGRKSIPGSKTHTNKIREIRLNKGLTAQQLAKMAGICIHTVKRLEASGKINRINLHKIAKVLDIPYSEIIEFEYVHSSITYYV